MRHSWWGLSNCVERMKGSAERVVRSVIVTTEGQEPVERFELVDVGQKKI
jgi:hypothetical protein